MRLFEAASGEGRRLGVRLASDDSDIRSAQALRWDIFYGAMGAVPVAGMGADGLDVDPYDAICDHLIVEDHGGERPVVVGTYRLLRQSVAARHSGFYSAAEYDLEPLQREAARRGGELLELGRSCVAPAYRDAATIQLLWRGIASYLAAHRIGLMFGCASFPGTDPDDHAAALAYLFHNHLAPADLRATALEERRVEMSRLPIGGYDPRQAMRRLPPLIRGYLRVGAMAGDGAVIDAQFNTIDVFMAMPVEAIAARYLDRFGAAA
jgi:putative hemolysin